MENIDTSNIDRKNSNTPVTETRLFSVNSKNGTSENGNKKSIVRFNLPGFIMGHADSAYVTMKILSATIPNVFYNINTDNFFYIQYINNYNLSSPVLANITVQPGHYDSYTVCSYLNSQLALFTHIPTSSGGTYTSLDKILQFYFNNTTAYIELHFTDNNISQLTTVLSPTMLALGFTTANTTMNINGITQQSLALSSNPTGEIIYQADSMPDLVGTTNLIVQSPQIPAINYCTELQSSFLANIPLTGDFGYISHYQYHGVNPYLLPTNLLLDVIQIYLYDQNGNYVDFRGNNWSIVFEVNYFRSTVPTYESLSQALERLVKEALLHKSNSATEEEDDAPPEKRTFLPVQILQLNPSGQKYLLEE